MMSGRYSFECFLCCARYARCCSAPLCVRCAVWSHLPPLVLFHLLWRVLLLGRFAVLEVFVLAASDEVIPSDGEYLLLWVVGVEGQPSVDHPPWQLQKHERAHGCMVERCAHSVLPCCV